MTAVAAYIVGMVGARGVGKNWVAENVLRPRYEDLGHSVEMASFAAPLKQMLIALNPLLPDGTRVADHDIEVAKNTYPEVRQLIQRLGTEAGRNILGEDIWISTAVKNLPDADVVIFTDVRFPDEAEHMDHIVRVEGPRGAHSDPHISERWRDLPYDEVYINR